jgi:hypothetical protein
MDLDAPLPIELDTFLQAIRTNSSTIE